VSDLNLWKASHNTALNATVVLAPEDLEGAVVAPVVVPRVGDQPVRGSLLDSPAQDSDGVTTKGLASHMLQQSQLVPEYQANISSSGPGKRPICSWGSPQRL